MSGNFANDRHYPWRVENYLWHLTCARYGKTSYLSPAPHRPQSIRIRAFPDGLARMLALKAILLLALLHEGNCQCGKLGTWYCEGTLTWVVRYHAGFHVLTLFNSSLRARQIWEDRSGLRGTSDSPECYRSRWQDSSYRRRRECD